MFGTSISCLPVESPYGFRIRYKSLLKNYSASRMDSRQTGQKSKLVMWPKQTITSLFGRGRKEANREGLQIGSNFLWSLNWYITVSELRMKNHDNHRFIFPKMEYLYHCLSFGLPPHPSPNRSEMPLKLHPVSKVSFACDGVLPASSTFPPWARPRFGSACSWSRWRPRRTVAEVWRRLGRL